MKNKWDIYLVGFIVFYFFLLALFPNQNPSGDAFAYAAQIKYSQDLFLPHHLLYNAFIWIVAQPLLLFYPHLEILGFAVLVNNCFATGSLVVLAMILSKLRIANSEIFLLVGICAVCYGFLRYGTENETYIIPLFLSLLATYFFLKFELHSNSKFLIISGLLGALSCLFHQLHIFWYVGLLIGLILLHRKGLPILAYCLPFLIVPLTYAFVYWHGHDHEFSLSGVIQFALSDYLNGKAGSFIGLKGILLGCISLARTILEVHPKIVHLVHSNWLFYFPFVPLLISIFLVVYYALKGKIIQKRSQIRPKFLYTLIMVLILHVLFAFYSNGNVEFMVMLPVLCALSVGYSFKFHKVIMISTMMTLLTWNFCYGLWPNHHLDYFNESALVQFAHRNTNAVLIVDSQIPITQFYYAHGIDDSPQFLYLKHFKQSTIDSLQFYGHEIYTPLITQPKILNRKSFVSESSESLFMDYFREPVLNYQTFYGPVTLERLIRK